MCSAFRMVMGMECDDSETMYVGFLQKAEEGWCQRCGGYEREMSNCQSNRAHSREARNQYECAKGVFIYPHIWNCIKIKFLQQNKKTSSYKELKSDLCGTLYNAFNFLNNDYKGKFDVNVLDAEGLNCLKKENIDKKLLESLVSRLEILSQNKDWAFFTPISGMLTVLEDMLVEVEKRGIIF